MSELHLYNITHTQNGKQVQLDVCKHLFVHAQRLPCKSMLRSINKIKYSSKSRDDGTEKVRAKQTKELTDEVADDQGVHDNRNMCQHGLGLSKIKWLLNITTSCTRAKTTDNLASARTGN